MNFLPSFGSSEYAFALTLLLGHAVLFLFDWGFACLAFYTTEVWGLGIVRVGVGMFFSGALVPLDMMPAWLQNIAMALPFAQVIYVPVAIFSEIIPLNEVPGLIFGQLTWLVGLFVLSRLIFSRSVRKVTVQGG